MMNKLQTILLLVIIIILMISLISCGYESDIRSCLKEFEDACHILDAKTMLDCWKPSLINNIVRLGVGVLDSLDIFSKDDIDGVLNFLLGLIFEEPPEFSAEDFFSTVHINPDKISRKDDTAVISAVVSFNIFEQEYKNIARIECVKYEDKWYISSFQFE